jgi:hypothetical protein
MADVFISYAREDRDTARIVAKALEADECSVWWDRQILGGENFDEVIERELDLAKSVIVLWSTHSVSSDWVRSEAAAAAERGVLVPAYIDEVKLPLQFRRRQTIDLTAWEGDPNASEFEPVRQAVAAHLRRKFIPLAPSHQASRKSGRILFFGGSVIFFAFAVFTSIYLYWAMNGSPPENLRRGTSSDSTAVDAKPAVSQSIPKRDSGQQQGTEKKPEMTPPVPTENPNASPPAAAAAVERPVPQAEPQPNSVKPTPNASQAPARLKPQTPILPNSDYLVGLQTVGVEQERWNDLATAIESVGFHLYKRCSNAYSEKQSWHAAISTVFYYHEEAKQKAAWVADFMNKQTELKFQVARGAGQCVDPDRKKTTLFVHVLPRG